MSSPRDITRIVTAHRQREGAGFIVRRPFPGPSLALVDPFLMLDEFGPIDYRPGEARGAPDHPHRGFETVSYLLAGEFEHADSQGHRGTIGAGAAQWMTAGSGVVHAEMPSHTIQREGGRVHGFQLWVNLPARDKLIAPRYQEIAREAVAEASSDDGLAQVRVLAGTALGATARVDTRTPIAFHDWTLRPGAALAVPLPTDFAGFVYVFSGAAEVGASRQRVSDGQLGLLGPGDELRLANPSDVSTRLLLIAGTPLGEPVARYGPFVMNTPAEIEQALRDYQAGKMGVIAARRD